MPALHRELSHYLSDVIQKRPCSVVIIGDDVDIIASAFGPEFNVSVLSVADWQPRTLSWSSSSEGNKTYDAVLLNGVLTALDYGQLKAFLGSLLQLVRLDGYVQVRAYLGDAKLNLAHYTDLFDKFRVDDPAGNCSFGFKILWEQGLRDTIYKKHDWQDHCWMFVKSRFPPVVKSPKGDSISVRDFLDHHQYTPTGIKAYEWIFGHGFISPGGERQNAKFLAQLNLKPGDTVLDIGAGIGGNAFQIAHEYGAHVMGVDLSSNMVNMACERACLKKDTRVRFLIADITQFEFEPHTFDVVYSRDCIIHIPDKSSLFNKIYKWLKPGGRVLITDYMVGEKEHTEEFKRYLAVRQYGLRPLRKYVEAAKEAGFDRVHGEDITSELRHLIELERSRALADQEEFLQMFPEADLEHLLEGWHNKIGYIDSGDHKWGVITATKPE